MIMEIPVWTENALNKLGYGIETTFFYCKHSKNGLI